MAQFKMAYMVATPELQCGEKVTALQGDLEDSFRIVSEAGYQGAELMVGDPARIDIGLIETLAKNYGLEIPALCTGEVFGQFGLSFMNPDESVRREALQRTRRIIDMASTFGCLVNIGRLRGSFVPEVPRSQSLDWRDAAFDNLCAYAAPRGVTLILEPVAYPFCNNINSTRDGIEVVKKVGHDCFKLMLDVFSMNMEDPSMSTAFRDAAPYLDHIHVCDSNRLAPGMGAFNFKDILCIISDLGYEKYISAEIYQAPDGNTAIDRTTQTLMALVR